MKKLTGKTAVITGAASGMGRSISLLFASEGANVILADLNEQELKELEKVITGNGGVAMAMICNVAAEADWGQLFRQAEERFGAVDILVNNAGIMDDFMPVENLSNDLWDKVMDINLRGPFLGCRLAVKGMLTKGKGVIINIASIGGLQGSRAGAVYTASKHGLIGLTKNIGFMYSQKGIRCNAIAPGGVNTNIGKNMHPDPFGYERCTSGSASMPRMGESDEIARVALFLASDDSSFINGEVLTADGGWVAY
jgi:NAD(P)-dependent dehydrogenase (short-subunit alcohol dehydrogenase family)